MNNPCPYCKTGEVEHTHIIACHSGEPISFISVAFKCPDCNRSGHQNVYGTTTYQNSNGAEMTV